MVGNNDKKKASPDSSDEDETPEDKKTNPSSTGKRSRIELEALEAMLKKKKNQNPDSE